MITKLPEPDKYGNYWFCEHLKPWERPAIFPSKRLAGETPDGEKLVACNGYYIVTLGADGFLFDGGKLRKFNTPQEAMNEINARTINLKGPA